LCTSTAEVTFHRNDLVIKIGAQVHTILPPSIKVATGAHSTAYRPARVLLGVPDRPKLLESLDTIDRGLVDSSRLENVIIRAVAPDGTLSCSSGRRVIRTVGFDNVIFDEWTASPSVDGKISVAVWVVSSIVVNDTTIKLSVLAWANLLSFTVHCNQGSILSHHRYFHSHSK